MVEEAGILVAREDHEVDVEQVRRPEHIVRRERVPGREERHELLAGEDGLDIDLELAVGVVQHGHVEAAAGETPQLLGGRSVVQHARLDLRCAHAQCAEEGEQPLDRQLRRTPDTQHRRIVGGEGIAGAWLRRGLCFVHDPECSSPGRLDVKHAARSSRGTQPGRRRCSYGALADALGQA